MPGKSELPPFIFEASPWEKQTNSIWPVSNFILHRNLAKYLFPSKLSNAETGQLTGIIQSVLLSIKDFADPIFFKAPELSALDKEYLFEHFLCLEGFQNTLDGQAFLIDKTSQLLVQVNIQDHFQIQLTDQTGDLEKNWKRLSQIDNALNEKLDFAFSPKFGYLTSDPGCCGTGFILESFLHLPALIHMEQLGDALENELEENVFATGLEGSLEELVGDLIILTNHYTLGLSEEAIIHSLNMSTVKLMSAEKMLRSHLAAADPQGKMKDLISRAYGLLLHSFQLQTKETLDALSLMKLALDLGWITGITDSKLNEVFFKCRRAHLAYLTQEKTLDSQDLGPKRAEYIHKELKGLVLKI